MKILHAFIIAVAAVATLWIVFLKIWPGPRVGMPDYLGWLEGFIGLFLLIGWIWIILNIWAGAALLILLVDWLASL